MREISEQDALERLRARISYGMRIKTLATKFGVSQAFMSMVLAGKKRMTEPMLRSIGVERKVTYLLKESSKAANPSKP